MAVMEMMALRAGLIRGQRLLGLDPGAKSIGLALSDVGLMLASPFAQIRRAKFGANVAELARIIEAQGVGGLVVQGKCLR